MAVYNQVATATHKVNIWYRCSKCGTENLNQEAIVVSNSRTSTRRNAPTFGVETGAKMELNSILLALQDENNLNRYDKACFAGRCVQCKHREPWARMRMPWPLLALYVICWLAAIPMVFFLIGNLGNARMENATEICSIASVVCVAYIILHSIINKIRLNKLHEEIAQLPADAHPQILPYDDLQYARFHAARRNATVQQEHN